MQTLTDARNAPTEQQKRDFTENVGDTDTVAVAIAIEDDSARLVDDEWHHENGGGNPATDTHARAVETALSNIDGGTQHLGETRDGADPKEGVSYRPIYYSQNDFDTARNMYQAAADHMAQPPAAN